MVEKASSNASGAFRDVNRGVLFSRAILEPSVNSWPICLVPEPVYCVAGRYGVYTVDQARIKVRKKLADVLEGAAPLQERKKAAAGESFVSANKSTY
jgi:hypothetical protein